MSARTHLSVAAAMPIDYAFLLRLQNQAACTSTRLCPSRQTEGRSDDLRADFQVSFVVFIVGGTPRHLQL